MVCNKPKSSCYLIECKKFPGGDIFCKKIQELSKDHKITATKYKSGFQSIGLLYNLFITKKEYFKMKIFL